MSGMGNINLVLNTLALGGYRFDIKGSTLLFISLVILSLAWAMVSYRKTLPPSRLGIRVLLGALRFSALLALIFLIFEPTISKQSEESLKPLLPVIFDDSQSMTMEDASGLRSVKVEDLLNNPVWKDLEDKFDLVYFSAGDSLRKLEELSLANLPLNNIGTDLASALTDLSEVLGKENFTNCIVVSDGGNNQGRDPIQKASETQIRIFTIGIGDTSRIQDARITSIVGDEIAYKDKRTQITARVNALGLENQTGRLELLDPEGRILASETIKFPGDDMAVERVLEFEPDTVGVLPVKVRLVTPVEELRLDNNLRTFPIEVLESRIRVLLLSIKPCFEAHFFLQAVADMPDIKVRSMTVKNGTEIYGQDASQLERGLQESDVVVVIGVLPGGKESSLVNRLNRAVKGHTVPVWLWTGSRIGTADLVGLYGENLPFKITPASRQMEGEAYPVWYYHELDPDSEVDELQLWRNLPPVKVPEFLVHLEENAIPFVSLKDPETGQEIEPALIGWERSNARYAAFLGAGYWRWSFLSQEQTGSNEFYASMLMKMLRWLSASPKLRSLNVSIERNLYSTGEYVNFDAKLRSGEGELIATGQIEVAIEGPEGASKIQLEHNQNGYYTASFTPEGVGTYHYAVLATINDEPAGADSGSFYVEAYNIEQETLRQNYSLLSAISEISGGAYIQADSLRRLVDLIEAPPRILTISWDRRFFLNWDLWVIIVMLLALEWFLRKRRGML